MHNGILYYFEHLKVLMVQLHKVHEGYKISHYDDSLKKDT
jgi:hypothetical protein